MLKDTGQGGSDESRVAEYRCIEKIKERQERKGSELKLSVIALSFYSLVRRVKDIFPR